MRDKGGYYKVKKGPVHQEDITVVNINAPNIKAPKFVQQMLTEFKGEIKNNKIIARDFNNGWIIRTESQ
jgi:hypothetical protein